MNNLKICWCTGFENEHLEYIFIGRNYSSTAFCEEWNTQVIILQGPFNVWENSYEIKHIFEGKGEFILR